MRRPSNISDWDGERVSFKRVGDEKMAVKNIFRHQNEVVLRIFGKREEGLKLAIDCRIVLYF